MPDLHENKSSLALELVDTFLCEEHKNYEVIGSSL